MVVLWVRSYSALDAVRVPYATNSWIHFQSFDGRVIVLGCSGRSPRPVPWIGSLPAKRHSLSQALNYAIIGNQSMSAVFYVTTRLAVMPHWLLAFVLGAIGVFAWLPTIRFSVRTLLIATTLVAVVLGLIVWSSR